MNILLKHPLHGSKIATMELEAEEDEKNGWVRYTVDAPVVNKLKQRKRVDNATIL
jgi:hypothetical protein